MAVNDLITFRKGPASQWISVNPVLASGEPGYDLTNSILKIGDGVSNWVSLSGIGSTSVGGSSSSYVGVRGIISTTGNLTSFAVSGGYPVGYLDLFQDGIKLVSDLDFSATDGSNVSLSNSVPSGTVLEYLTISSGVSSGSGSGLSWSSVPASATASGTAGQIAYDDVNGFFYVATATNTWKRVALSTWTIYKVYDSFTGADNTALMSHTPDTKPTGASWSFLGTSSDGNNGNFIISSNRLLNTVHPGNGNNSTSKAWIECGSADVTLSAVLSLGSNNNTYALGGFIFRYVNSSNFMRLDIGRDGFDSFALGWTIRLLAVVNGSGTVVATAGTGTDLARDTEYTLTTSVVGDYYTASIGGLTLSASSSANASATSHGLFIDNTVSRGTGSETYFDNFAVI